jgi:hypothetical protein
LAYLAYLAEDFRSQRSDALRANKNLLYGDFEGLFTSQNLQFTLGRKNPPLDCSTITTTYNDTPERAEIVDVTANDTAE